MGLGGDGAERHPRLPDLPAVEAQADGHVDHRDHVGAPAPELGERLEAAPATGNEQLGEQLVRPKRRLAEAEEELFEWKVAGAAFLGAQRHSGPRGDQRGDQIRGGRGVADVSSHRGPIANLRAGKLASGLQRAGKLLAKLGVEHQVAHPCASAEPEPVWLWAHVAEVGEVRDGHQAIGLELASLEAQHHVGRPRDRTGQRISRREQVQRVRQVLGDFQVDGHRGGRSTTPPPDYWSPSRRSATLNAPNGGRPNHLARR